MSNLAVGIALGAAMNSGAHYSGGSDLVFSPAMAVFLLVTLVLSWIIPVIELYRKDSSFLESHWERLILGPLMGMAIWTILLVCIGLVSWLYSFIV